MRYGFVIPGGDVHAILDLAVEAEAAGWDGIFYWDGICIESVGPMYDSWAVLAAMALRTRRIRIGAILTPPARRRPWKLARETTTVDHLSNGRLILPVGLGALDDGGFAKVGEPTDRKVRAALLDESLQILTGLWSGQPFSYHGEHYHLDELTFLPAPLQTPRIPIWVAGRWPRAQSMDRVRHYDGWIVDGDASPLAIRAGRAWIDERRTESGPFDIIWEGETPGDDSARAAEIIGPYVEAGITWWIESRWGVPIRVEEARARIQQGPPRLD